MLNHDTLAHDARLRHDRHMSQGFGRLIIEALLDNELTPERARALGQQAGHYAIRILDAEADHARVVTILQGAFGAGR